MRTYSYLRIFLLSAGLIFLPLANTASAASVLMNGSHGHEVIELQQQLRRTGYRITSVDGIFGKETKRAVLEFQRDQHMKITGNVDRATWSALKKAPDRAHASSISSDAAQAQKYPLPSSSQTSPSLHRQRSAHCSPPQRNILVFPINLAELPQRPLTVPATFNMSSQKMV